MIEQIALLVFTSLYSVGIHVATRYMTSRIYYNQQGEQVNPEVTMNYNPDTYDQVFEPKGSMAMGILGYWAESLLPEWIHKPLVSCLSCMASFHGTYIYLGYWILHGCPERMIWLIWWPIFIFALCGLNSLLGQKMDGI